MWQLAAGVEVRKQETQRERSAKQQLPKLVLLLLRTSRACGSALLVLRSRQTKLPGRELLRRRLRVRSKKPLSWASRVQRRRKTGVGLTTAAGHEGGARNRQMKREADPGTGVSAWARAATGL